MFSLMMYFSVIGACVYMLGFVWAFQEMWDYYQITMRPYQRQCLPKPSYLAGCVIPALFWPGLLAKRLIKKQKLRGFNQDQWGKHGYA